MNDRMLMDDGSETPELVRAVRDYLTQIESDRFVSKSEFLAAYPELAPELERYLETIDLVNDAARILEFPDGATVGTENCDGVPQEPLGDFRLLREIGRGGMGTVYEALQMSLGRKVALKVLPFAAAFDKRQLQRFKNEAQAAAALHHPNIVPVYGVGFERGVHFYTMQLIDGDNLAAIIAAVRSERGRRIRDENGVDPEDQLSPAPAKDTLATPAMSSEISAMRSRRRGEYDRFVTRLVAEAAEALEYAHDRGVVHRDIKPANILIDRNGSVWVTDFGLAQFQTGASLTRSGALVGTLRYMSPEQAGGRRDAIDHRTDIYSLGATFMELLTLRPIFESSDEQTLLYRILHEEPLSPRTIDRSIPVELETIALKAISKDPSRRYATADEMATDLRRYLDGTPIHARRPTIYEKVIKWARRHRGAVYTGAATLLLTLVALSVSTILVARAYDRAQDRAYEAEVHRKRAEANFQQARQAVEEFSLVSELGLAGDPQYKHLRCRMLQLSLDYYQDFIEQHRDDPDLQAELKTSRQRVKTIVDRLTVLMEAPKYELLNAESVRKELKLSETQRTALDDVRNQLGGPLPRPKAAPTAEDAERIQLARFRKVEQFVAKILTPDQHKRFNEIAMQKAGPLIFSIPSVVTKLRLTRQQLMKIQRIFDARHAKIMHGHHGHGPEPGPPHMHGTPPHLRGSAKPKGKGERRPPGHLHHMPSDTSMDEWSEEREQVFTFLTSAQKQAWKELIGKRFEGKISEPRDRGPLFGPQRP